MTIRPWQKIATGKVGDFRIFSIRSERKVSPRTHREHEFYVIDAVNWVNVVALTPDRQVVMIEQYRHGSNTVELEIPGGMIDATDQSAVAAGVRELREETGFEGESACVIGEVFPNPAIMSNTCYTILVENCRCVHPTQLDHAEDLLTRLVPLADVAQMVASGAIRHSLVVVALYHLDLRLRSI